MNIKQFSFQLNHLSKVNMHNNCMAFRFIQVMRTMWVLTVIFSVLSSFHASFTLINEYKTFYRLDRESFEYMMRVKVVDKVLAPTKLIN